MSTTTLTFVIILGILLVGAWIVSEVISHKTKKNNRQYSKRLSELEKENRHLENNLQRQSARLNAIKEDFEKIKEAKAQISTLEKEFKKLSNRSNEVSKGLLEMRLKVGSKKYSSNSLAKEVLEHLHEHCPDEQQLEEMRENSTRAAFTRIKNAIS